MFGRVTYARRRCKAGAISVYLTHILLSMGSCSLRSNERILSLSLVCVSFTRVISYKQLTLQIDKYYLIFISQPNNHNYHPGLVG